MKKYTVALLLACMSLNACISQVTENTKLSVKLNKKMEQITLVTKTSDRALDPNAGLIKENYYRTMLNQLESDIKTSGIEVNEIQFKADETSLDPDADLAKLMKEKNVKNTFFVEAVNISKSGNTGSIYGMSYNVVLMINSGKDNRTLYEGSKAVSQTVDLGTDGKMRDLGDKIFVSIKPALGIE